MSTLTIAGYSFTILSFQTTSSDSSSCNFSITFSKSLKSTLRCALSAISSFDRMTSKNSATNSLQLLREFMMTGELLLSGQYTCRMNLEFRLQHRCRSWQPWNWVALVSAWLRSQIEMPFIAVGLHLQAQTRLQLILLITFIALSVSYFPMPLFISNGIFFRSFQMDCSSSQHSMFWQISSAKSLQVAFSERIVRINSKNSSCRSAETSGFSVISQLPFFNRLQWMQKDANSSLKGAKLTMHTSIMLFISALTSSFSLECMVSMSLRQQTTLLFSSRESQSFQTQMSASKWSAMCMMNWTNLQYMSPKASQRSCEKQSLILVSNSISRSCSPLALSMKGTQRVKNQQRSPSRSEQSGFLSLIFLVRREWKESSVETVSLSEKQSTLCQSSYWTRYASRMRSSFSAIFEWLFLGVVVSLNLKIAQKQPINGLLNSWLPMSPTSSSIKLQLKSSKAEMLSTAKRRVSRHFLTFAGRAVPSLCRHWQSNLSTQRISCYSEPRNL